MTPSVILLFICSALFIVLFVVFTVFLLKAAHAAKARSAGKSLPAGISKQMHPAENEFTVNQGQLRIAKAK